MPLIWLMLMRVSLENQGFAKVHLVVAQHISYLELLKQTKSSIALLAITTDISTTSRGRYPLTELDQVSLFQPVTKWNATLDDASRLPANVRTAFREMTTGTPGAVHLALPFDTQKMPVDESEIWANSNHVKFPANQVAANNDSIIKGANILENSKSAVAICGGGVVIANAYKELQQIGELIELPIATTISGQGSIAGNTPSSCRKWLVLMEV